MKRLFFFLFAVFNFLVTLKAQDEEKHKPSLTLGVSALKFTGDVGKENELSPILDTKLGYYLAVEQRFGKIFGVSIGGLYGQLQGTDHSANSHRNFRTQIIQGEILATANFDKVFKNDPAVSPFLNLGIGYMTFNPKGDLYDKNGYAYNYWADGSIRYLAETPYNVATYGNDPSTIIKRDYNYETTLKDSTANYARGGLILPMGGGLNFHFGTRWTASVGVNYVMVLSDYVDNYKKGGFDSYLQANVALQYEFKKKKKSASENVDFSSVDNLDVDKDGIPDDKDDCLGTPAGVAVDKHGCPPDSDKDGVPDYLDKEANTKKGSQVDGNGVTINVDSLALKQLYWDSLSTERSEAFNEQPTIVYLKSVEAQSTSINQGRPSRIPIALREADYDNNGIISVDEITRVIDGFFEGTNSFNADGINRLIDFFFEQ